MDAVIPRGSHASLRGRYATASGWGAEGRRDQSPLRGLGIRRCRAQERVRPRLTLVPTGTPFRDARGSRRQPDQAMAGRPCGWNTLPSRHIRWSTTAKRRARATRAFCSPRRLAIARAQWRKTRFRGVYLHAGGSLVQCVTRERVAGFGDRSRTIRLAGLVSGVASNRSGRPRRASG